MPKFVPEQKLMIMTYQVDVFSEEPLQVDVMSEVKEALVSIEKKYNCRFELSADNNPELKESNNLINRLKAESASNEDGVYLSFGGELEL